MTTATRTRKSTAKKAVKMIARIQFKDDARKVVYLVRSSDGEGQYHTYLFDGKATSCDCAARKPCKHMEKCEAEEAERQAAKVRVMTTEETEVAEAVAVEGAVVFPCEGRKGGVDAENALILDRMSRPQEDAAIGLNAYLNRSQDRKPAPDGASEAERRLAACGLMR